MVWVDPVLFPTCPCTDTGAVARASLCPCPSVGNRRLLASLPPHTEPVVSGASCTLGRLRDLLAVMRACLGGVGAVQTMAVGGGEGAALTVEAWRGLGSTSWSRAGWPRPPSGRVAGSCPQPGVSGSSGQGSQPNTRSRILPGCGASLKGWW